MKKAIFLRFVVLCFVFLGYEAKAVKYFIPDLKFRAYLQVNFAGCMNATGDSLEGSCPAVLNATTVDVRAQNISNLNGIQVFQNLKNLYCQANQLTSLPTLPFSLSTLDCYNNQLTSLPQFPSSLQNLFCGLNQLTNLPVLPFSLDSLDCNNNQLNNLPALPSSLIYLCCFNNQLTNLPALPTSLSDLRCYNNQLSSLPTLPPTLTNLFCYDNQLTSLPALPSALTTLVCSTNQLTNLPTLPSSLHVLKCESNQLTNLPTIPSSLLYLDCYNNQLTSIPILPSTLISLICSNNQLTSLPALPSSLKSLKCEYNQFTSLPTLPSTLTDLFCSVNQLTSLPALSSSLINLVCVNNQLTNLPTLPPTLKLLICSYNNNLNCLPDLKNVEHLDISYTGIQCLLSYGKITFCRPALFTIPICDIFNTNNCEVPWNIIGNVFYDTDSNCVKAISEKSIANQKIQLFQNGSLTQETFSNKDGNYYFDTDSLSIYSTSMDTTSVLFSIHCPINATYTDTLTAIDSIKINRNFAATCNGIDLAVSSIYGAGFRPASQRPLIIYAGDFSNYFGGRCAAGVSGSVQIIVSGPCQYVSASSGALLPTTINGDTLVYSIADFGSINYKTAFVIEVLVDTFAIMGSQICVHVEISTTANEIDTTNNNLTQCFNVVNSYDPNDKSVYPTQLQPGVNNWLTYNINFQNTGNADAIDIFITDTLDAKLDWSTFELLSYSHLPLIQLYNKGIIKFNYPKIYLPDSTNNEPESHGYVQFKIKSKNTLLPGDVINNKANIYFDFNPPIITNTATATACPVLSNISASFCFNTTYDFNGQIISSPGIYRDTLPSQSGCDSIVILDLSLVPTITNTITQNNAQLSTSGVGSMYNWIDCTTGLTVPNEIANVFNPPAAGSYSAVVYYGNCIDTSACFQFVTTGIVELNDAIVNINPNPFQEELTITRKDNRKETLEVYNLLGEQILQTEIQDKRTTLSTQKWPAGIYIVKVIGDRDVVNARVVKY
jgi:uncharacterized repeat protein (TIGR01451 family)